MIEDLLMQDAYVRAQRERYNMLLDNLELSSKIMYYADGTTIPTRTDKPD